MIEDLFYTAWPLTLVFWLVFILAIAGYAVVLVVGIRYVIRTIIVLLRRGGYIASDFVKEVVDTVKSEIPIVEADRPEEIDFAEMKNKIAKKMEEERAKYKPIGEEDETEVVEKAEARPMRKSAIKELEPEITEVEVEEETKEQKIEEKPKKSEKEKSGTDKVNDIFDM